MSQHFPQTILEKIVSHLDGAMPTLVNPPPNPDLLAKIPEFRRVLEQHLPAGHTRDCLIAGLWLLADDLEQSHTLCQNVPTIYGSAWHAVMHRREGDFSNSQYWFRRTSGIRWQGLSATLRRLITPLNPPEPIQQFLTADEYQPAAFVDIVSSHHRRPDPAVTPLLLTIQRQEWLTL